MSVDKKLIPVLLEDMKWPPAGNFKSHSKYLLKFGEALFLFDEDSMDFKKLVNYICEFVWQVSLWLLLIYFVLILLLHASYRASAASFNGIKISATLQEIICASKRFMINFSNQML